MSKKKQIALTFDDGPNKETEDILKILRQYQARATFFIWGEKSKESYQVLKDLVAEGHQLANHTWTHPNLKEVEDDAIRVEIEKTDTLIAEITGEIPTLFRPPYGEIDTRVEGVVQKTVVLWSVDSRDWSGIEADEIIKNVLQNCEENAIVLLHCFENTVKALPEIMENLAAQDYEFVLVDQVLNN